MKDLTFPRTRFIDEVTTDEHLGKMSVALWVQVEADLQQAFKENSTVLDEVWEKIYAK